MKTNLIPGRLRLLSGGPYEKPVFPFAFQFRPPEDSAAVALRTKYRLLEVAGDGSDFVRARRLKTWVRRRWEHGYDDHGVEGKQPQDALDILAAAARGKKFHCWFYRRTLTQCCLAVGIVAREMGACRKDIDFPDAIGSNHSHAVTEVYCRELGKWVMLDADANAFYTIGGIPANVLEVHHAWHANRGRRVKQVLDSPRFVIPTDARVYTADEQPKVWREFVRHRTMDYYHHIFAHLLNGFSIPPSNPEQKFVFYAGTVPPLLLMTYYGNDLDRFLFVEEPSHFNWPVNRTYLTAAMQPGKPSHQIEVRLDHTMPFFDHFEVSIGPQPFRRIKSDRLRFACPAGKTVIQARCVDSFGRAGESARACIELRPASAAVLARRKSS